MVKIERPVRINLPNGRTFTARYKRATGDELPPSIRLKRPYRQREGPQSRRRQPLAAVQQQCQGISSLLKGLKVS